MSLLQRIPFLQRDVEIDEGEVRDVAEILELGRPPRRAENLRFTVKTRGKSPACLFGREQMSEAVLHCMVTEPVSERL